MKSPRAPLWLSLALLAGTASAETRLVVAVGSNAGLPGEATLRFAESDAERFAEVMVDLGGVATRDAVVLGAPSVARLEEALARIRDRALQSRTADQTVVFYFSGHGDDTNLHVGDAAWPIARLEGILADIPARTRLLVLDACRSGAGRGKGLGADAGFALDLRRPTGPAGTVTVRSSAAGEAAQESDELEGALFTHAFVSALRGAADRDGDRQVTFAEAYEYAYARTLQRSAASAGNVQHASMEAELSAEGPWVLSRLRGEAAALGVAPEADVQYLAFARPSGSFVAEFWSSPDRAVSVQLPPGRYLVQRRAAGRAGAAEVTLGLGARLLRPADFEVVEIGTLASKGGRVELRPHEFELSGGFSADTDGGVGPALRAGYGRRFAALVAEVAAAGHAHTRHSPTDFFREHAAGVTGTLSWRLPSGPVEVRLGAGVDTRLVFQTIEPRDAERRAAGGYRASPESNVALLGGPRAALSFGLEVQEGLSIRLTADGSALAFRRAGDLETRLEAGVVLGVGYAF